MIEPKDPGALPHRLRTTDEDSDSTGAEQQEALLEVSQMNKISSKIQVAFRWPDQLEPYGESDGPSTFALQSRRGWLRQRKLQEMDVDSLLEITDVQ